MSTQPDSNASPVACPKCGKKMVASMVGTVEVDKCSACGGLWLDVFEREQLMKDKKAVKGLDGEGPFTPVSASGTPLTCPRDHSRLIVMCDPNQPHVKFESCKVCGGTFLDRGEMTDLASFSLIERIRQQLGFKV